MSGFVVGLLAFYSGCFIVLGHAYYTAGTWEGPPY